MKYKLFQVEPNDIDELDVKDCYSVGEIGCSKDLIHLSLMTEDSIALGFGLEDGTLHGIAGSYRVWPGSSQLWAVFSSKADCNPIALTKICDALIDYAVKRQKLRRVSLNVRSSYDKGNRFAQFLKFEFEGKMRAFLPDGEDANLYARTY